MTRKTGSTEGQDIGRRDTLKLGLTAAAAATLAGAGGSRPSRAQSDNILHCAWSANSVRTLDPHYMRQGADAWTNRQVHNCLVDPPLGTFDINLPSLRGELAESWDLSDDSLVWTLNLRQGVPWHRGYGEVTADDVVFSYQRMADPASRYSVALRNMAEVRATDTHQVQFTLTSPDPTFHAIALISPMYIMSRAAVEDLGDEGIAMNPVGSGPFKFEGIDTDRGVILSANDDYFDGRPAIDGIENRYMPDTAARTLAFVNGDLDMIDGARQPGWVQQMQAQAPDATINATAPGSLVTLAFNMTRPPFDNVLVRKAIRYAIDRNVFIDAFGPMCTNVWGINPTQFDGSIQQQDLSEELQYNVDLERSRALLAEAGYPDGLQFDAFVSQREDYQSIMLLIQEMLRQANIEMNLDIIDHTAFHNERRADRGMLMPFSKTYPPVNTQILFEQFSSGEISREDSSGGVNHSHYGEAIPGIDARLAEIAVEPDLARRNEMVRQAELQILQDMPSFTLTTMSLITLLGPRVDLGFTIEAGYPQYTLGYARLLS